MRRIILGSMILMLMLQLAFAVSDRVLQISNGGNFSLEKGEQAILQFNDFTERRIILASVEKDAITWKSPEQARPFFKENKQTSSNIGVTHLTIGEEARSHETVEMLCIIKLEEVKGSKAVFKVTYYSAPPAPKISPWQKVTIQIVR